MIEAMACGETLNLDQSREAHGKSQVGREQKHETPALSEGAGCHPGPASRAGEACLMGLRK
jgi:hypothetical protein